MTKNILLMMKYIFICLLAAVFLLPFIWMIAFSLKSAANFAQYPPSLLVSDPQWSNFLEVLNKFSLFRYFLNSLLVSTAISVLQVITASMAGFAFAMLAFRGKTVLFTTFLSSLMIPSTVILIPLFLVVRNMGLIDSYLGLILPFIFTGYGIFMMRQFFMSLPKDFFHAGMVDGCGIFRTYWKIYLPLAKPSVITLGTLAFIFYWNTLLWPLISTNNNDLKTIPVGIAGLVGENMSLPHLVVAGATISVLPGLILFLALQRYYTQGYVMTGVKG
jgi:ABC-type glycerol-3-phosphate transport system permease component